MLDNVLSRFNSWKIANLANRVATFSRLYISTVVGGLGSQTHAQWTLSSSQKEEFIKINISGNVVTMYYTQLSDSATSVIYSTTISNSGVTTDNLSNTIASVGTTIILTFDVQLANRSV